MSMRSSRFASISSIGAVHRTTSEVAGCDPIRRQQNVSRSTLPHRRSSRVIAYVRCPTIPMSSMGAPSDAPTRVARRTDNVKLTPFGSRGSLSGVPASTLFSVSAHHTLAPPAPVALPTLTTVPMPLSANPAANRSAAEYVVEATTATTGPPYTWPMSLHRSEGVIGTDCEYTSPVPTASSNVRLHGLNDRRFCGASLMARVRSEAMIEKRVGEIDL